MEAVVAGGLIIGFIATFAKGLYDRMSEDVIEPREGGFDHIEYMLYFDNNNV